MTPIILNPSAGGGRAWRSGLRALSALEGLGVSARIISSRDRQETRGLAADFASLGAPHVLVCGGDGTVNAAANGLALSNTALGIIPAGRGNDLARALGIPMRPKESARLLATRISDSSPPIRIDLGCVNGTYFTTVAAFGLDAAVSRRMRTMSVGRGRRVQYLISAVAEVFRYDPCRVVVSGDFGERQFHVFVCATANTPNYGGLYRISPHAKLDDGLLDVCMVCAVAPLRAVYLTLHAMRGSHVDEPEVEVCRSRHVHIDSDAPRPLFADGEFLADTPVTITVAPGALRVLALRKPSAV